jgi:hypothetical protein
MKKILIYIFCLIYHNSLPAQFFFRYYNEYPGSIQNIHPLENGEFLISGTLNNSAQNQEMDIYWTRIDASGNPLINPIALGSDSVENGISSLLLNNNNLAVVYQRSSSAGSLANYASSVFSIFDLEGNLFAETVIQGRLTASPGNGFLEMSDGSFIILNTFNGDIQLTKLSSNGIVIFQTQYESTALETARAIVTNSDGDFFISANYRETPSSPGEVIILKADPLGNFVWSQVIVEDGANLNAALLLDEAENLYLVGTFILNGPTPADIQVYKFSPLGELIWNSKLDIPEHYLISQNALYSNGSIYITGDYGNPSIGEMGVPAQVLIAKVDTTGTYLWHHQLFDTNATGYNSSSGFQLTLSAENELVIGGKYFSSITFLSLLIKTNLDGIVRVQEENCCQNNSLVYPNPAQSQLMINLNEISAPQVLRIYNSRGELVDQKTIGSNGILSIEHLNAGIYLIKPTEGVSSWRFVKI